MTPISRLIPRANPGPDDRIPSALGQRVDRGAEQLDDLVRVGVGQMVQLEQVTTEHDADQYGAQYVGAELAGDTVDRIADVAAADVGVVTDLVSGIGMRQHRTQYGEGCDRLVDQGLA